MYCMCKLSRFPKMGVSDGGTTHQATWISAGLDTGGLLLSFPWVSSSFLGSSVRQYERVAAQ